MNVVFHNSHLGKCFSIPCLHQSAKYPDKTFVNMPVLDAQKLRKKKGISMGKNVKIRILSDLKPADALQSQKK